MINKKKIVFITGNNNFFGQTRKPWVSMNTDLIRKILEEKGFEIEKYSIHELVNGEHEIRNSIIFYSFSQKENVRGFLKDLIYTLKSLGNIVIPEYDFLLCHENKGYQEIFKKRLGIKSLHAFYFSSLRELSEYKLTFPSVLKRVDGSNGKGVFLVNSFEELQTKLKEFQKVDFLTKLDLLRRKYIRKEKSYAEYPGYTNKKDLAEYTDYVTKEDNFVLQQFIPNLKFDYRVLVISDRFYVTRRHNRDNDFRASGAKKFDFDFTPSAGLLNFAKEIYGKFDSPYLSIDICEADGKFYLIEYQALHFGINVFVKNKGFYSECEGDWTFEAHRGSIEESIAYGLADFIKDKFGE